MLDVSNPLKPFQLCTLSPASGGRFIAANRIAFWTSGEFGIADLATGTVSTSGELSGSATNAAFTPDGSTLAYRLGDDTNGLSTHLYTSGTDRTLVTRSGVGGHGIAPYGPTTQLEFSADGKYLLSVDSLFANFGSGPPNFLVYRMDGSIAFQSATASFGAWAPRESKLYFLAPRPPHSASGEVHAWDASSGETTVARGLSSYMWPQVSPDGRVVGFTSYDNSAPGSATGGLPHMWRLDPTTGAFAQLSTASSSRSIFVSPHFVWSGQEQPCECGPGGASAPAEKVVGHDLNSGQEGFVDLSWWAAQMINPVSFGAVVDVWMG